MQYKFSLIYQLNLTLFLCDLLPYSFAQKTVISSMTSADKVSSKLLSALSSIITTLTLYKSHK